jgi:hypothetical protein
MGTLVELCAGSAAITRKILGLNKLMGFMGSKDRYVDSILTYFRIPNIKSFILNDPGYFGVIWKAFSIGVFEQVANNISDWSQYEARTLFQSLNCSIYNDIARDAAAKICLLSSTYGGGEIGGFKGKHKLRPSVDGFIPSRETLINRVKAWSRTSADIIVHNKNAATIVPIPNSWCYIDPPYDNTSGYKNTLSRKELLYIAKNWADNNCMVAVSEGEPLDHLLGNDWMSEELKPNGGQIRKNSKSKKEFLTWNQK